MIGGPTNLIEMLLYAADVDVYENSMFQTHRALARLQTAVTELGSMVSFTMTETMKFKTGKGER